MDRLTEEEIESITAKALSENPHWEPDAWGLFGKVAKAQDKKTARWIIEKIDTIIRQSIKECEEFRGDKLEFFFVKQLTALQGELNESQRT